MDDVVPSLRITTLELEGSSYFHGGVAVLTSTMLGETRAGKSGRKYR